MKSLKPGFTFLLLLAISSSPGLGASASPIHEPENEKTSSSLSVEGKSAQARIGSNSKHSGYVADETEGAELMKFEETDSKFAQTDQLYEKTEEAISKHGRAFGKAGEHFGGMEPPKADEYYSKASEAIETVKSQGESYGKAEELIQSHNPVKYQEKTSEAFEKLQSQADYSEKAEEIIQSHNPVKYQEKTSEAFEKLQSQADYSEKATEVVEGFKRQAHGSYAKPASESFEKVKSHGESFEKAAEHFSGATKFQNAESVFEKTGETFETLKSQDEFSEAIGKFKQPQETVESFGKSKSQEAFAENFKNYKSTEDSFKEAGDTYGQFAKLVHSSSSPSQFYSHPSFTPNMFMSHFQHPSSSQSISKYSSQPQVFFTEVQRHPVVDTYDKEFEDLITGEGQFLKDGGTSSIVMEIIKLLGDLKKDVTPVLQKMAEDTTGSNVMEICKVAKARRIVETASESLSSTFYHIAKLEKDGNLEECRLKNYREFRKFQDTMNGVARDLSVVKDNHLDLTLDKVQSLTREAIRSVTLKEKES